MNLGTPIQNGHEMTNNVGSESGAIGQRVYLGEGEKENHQLANAMTSRSLTSVIQINTERGVRS